MSAPRRSRPILWAGAALAVALLVGGCGGGDGGADASAVAPSGTTTAPVASAPPTATAPVATGPSRLAVDRRYAVGVRTTTYVDPSRPTAAVPGYGGAPDRTFAVTIWYPAAGPPGGAPVADAPPERSGAPYPLVLFAHGYAVTPDFYEALLSRWAAAGYVVAAPAYPLLSGTPAGPSHADYRQVFTDTRFVLDQLLGGLGSTTGTDPLAGTVDPERVAVSGQSDGEVAAFGLGFLQCCRDERVKAVVAMAGVLGNVNNPILRDSGIPVLHLMGTADELQPFADAIAWDRGNLTAPRWLLTLVDGTHAPPYRDPDSPYFAGVVETTTAFLDGTLKGHPERLDAIDAFVAGNGDRFRLER